MLENSSNTLVTHKKGRDGAVHTLSRLANVKYQVLQSGV